MTDDRPSVYRAQRTLRFGGGDRVDADELVIDPPAFATDRLGRHLDRLDEDGRIPRETLRHMHYNQLQQLAAAGDVEDVGGNSDMEAITDAYALEEDDRDDESETIE